MEIKKEFVLREIAGDFVLVPVGKTVGEYPGLFPVTETAAEVWNFLPEAQSRDDIVNFLYDKYDAEKSVIENDVDDFLSRLSDFGII